MWLANQSPDLPGYPRLWSAIRHQGVGTQRGSWRIALEPEMQICNAPLHQIQQMSTPPPKAIAPATANQKRTQTLNKGKVSTMDALCPPECQGHRDDTDTLLRWPQLSPERSSRTSEKPTCPSNFRQSSQQLRCPTYSCQPATRKPRQQSPMPTIGASK